MGWWRPTRAETAPTQIEIEQVIYQLRKWRVKCARKRLMAAANHIDWLMLAIEGEWREQGGVL